MLALIGSFVRGGGVDHSGSMTQQCPVLLICVVLSCVVTGRRRLGTNEAVVRLLSRSGRQQRRHEVDAAFWGTARDRQMEVVKAGI